MGFSGSCSMVLFPVFISNSEIVLKIFYKKYIQFCTPWKGTQRGNIINIYTRTLINRLADGQRGYLSNKIYILTSPKIEEIFTFKSSLNAHLLSWDFLESYTPFQVSWLQALTVTVSWHRHDDQSINEKLMAGENTQGQKLNNLAHWRTPVVTLWLGWLKNSGRETLTGI